MGIADELKELFNMSESKRRSHVGMDVGKQANLVLLTL